MTAFAQPWRVSGVAGLLFVVLSLIAAGMNVEPPAYDQDAAVLAGWFDEHGLRFRTGHFVAGLAFLLFYFPFFAGFCERLREAEGTPAMWSRVAWAAAIISPAAGTASGAFIMGAALLEDRAAPEVALFGTAANFYAYVVSGAFGGVVMLAAAVVILRTGAFPRWLGWAGTLIGVAAISSTATLVENDPRGLFATINGLAWLAYFIWIAAGSVGLLRSSQAFPLRA
jgi:hypothetical protein